MNKKNRLQLRNPLIAAQMFESPFVWDAVLGHTMPPGKEFIGRTDFISMENLLRNLKRLNKKVILNIGDSSTSGWDSNIVTQNRQRIKNNQPLIPAFFQYETYSDYLQSTLGEDYIVINAGVPAHSSLQGSKRLELLLKKFKESLISIDWVTAYYGNNDSVWDLNIEDKAWVGRRLCSRVIRLRNIINCRKTDIITRVSAEDYKANMISIMQKCKRYQIPLIFIEPITPLYWKPGTRVQKEDLDRVRGPGARKAYESLDQSRRLWELAKNQDGYSELKAEVLKEAREMDYIVPRIKKSHLYALHEIIREFKISFVQVDLDRSLDDIRYFIDYCHPIKEANKFISNEIANIITKQSTSIAIVNKLLEKAESNIFQTSEKLRIPTDHYTLY